MFFFFFYPASKHNFCQIKTSSPVNTEDSDSDYAMVSSKEYLKKRSSNSRKSKPACQTNATFDKLKADPVVCLKRMPDWIENKSTCIVAKHVQKASECSTPVMASDGPNGTDTDSVPDIQEKFPSENLTQNILCRANSSAVSVDSEKAFVKQHLKSEVTQPKNKCESNPLPKENESPEVSVDSIAEKRPEADSTLNSSHCKSYKKLNSCLRLYRHVEEKSSQNSRKPLNWINICDGKVTSTAPQKVIESRLKVLKVVEAEDLSPPSEKDLCAHERPQNFSLRDTSSLEGVGETTSLEGVTGMSNLRGELVQTYFLVF